MSAYRKPTPWTRPPITTCRRSAVEALFPDERHEAAGNGTHECRSVVPANDELEQLVVTAADRHDQPAFRLQLLVESARRLRSRRSDGDRSEGGAELAELARAYPAAARFARASSASSA